MVNIFDRLQFVKHEEIFATREDAYGYVLDKQIFERPSLVAEPMILLYESDDAEKGPNVILAIGSVGNGSDPSTDNRTFFIDTQKTEEEIIALDEKIEQAIKSLTIIPVDSETLDISAEKTDDGTFLSGDVKIADYTIASGKVQNNIITVEEGKGLYAFVDMDYDPETFVITFNVNGAIKNFQLPPDQHVEKGWYSPADEALFLKLADGSKVKIDVVKLIDEWTVLSSASTTPIMLFKEHVSAYTEEHDGVYDWQDLLTADVRLADHISDNIIHKDRTGRFLYVKGTADNIKYKNNQTVAQALDSIDTRVSTSAGNMIYRRPDGLFASAMLDYNSAENKLIYRYTDTQTEDFKEISFTLNSVKILQDITYDPVKEVIVIRYIDAQGEYQRVEIPAKDIIEEWIVNNEAHNIELVKYRSEGQGKDILSADAKIHAGDNNILEDRDHKLYVNGISDNIKYDVTGDTTVKDVLDDLSGKTIATDVKLDAEIERAKAAEKELEDTIGSGFTSDPHDNVTYKFEALSAKVDSEIERSTTKDDELEAAIAAEEARATSAETVLDGRVDAIEDEIGEGFGPRNTVRDEIDNLQNEIDAVSADSASSLKDIINEDHSIDVDRTNPTKPVISVNLSTELEDDRKNIIKLNNDGLFANVDLDYIPEANKLILHKTDGEGDKEIQLESMSSIISIEYNPTKEAIVITYMTNGHEVKTVEIPVGDLINEWRVEDGHPHAVQLEKVRVASGTSEQDVLKASVIITDDHDDNILVMDDGALYVSGAQISANTAAIAAETERATDAEEQLAGDVEALSGAIDTEVERATTAEEVLSGAIDSEVERAEAAEEVLTNKIGTGFTDDPHENVTAKFEALSAKVDSEIERSTTKDEELANDIAAEETRAEAEEQALSGAIDNEVERATTVEDALLTSIETEVERAEAAEQVLTNKIGTGFTDNPYENVTYKFEALSAKVDSEIERSTTKDEELANDIAAETTRATNAESTLQTNINNETTRATTAEQALSGAIDSEVSRAENAEEVLTNKIGTGFTDDPHENVTAKFEALSGKLDTEIADRIADVDAEETRAKEAEQTLTTNLANEVTRAENAETTLQNNINNEETRATTAEQALSGTIDSEVERATDAERTLQANIDTERIRAISAETALQTALSTETARATSAETRLEHLIEDEATARANADSVITNNLNAEVTRATSTENRIEDALRREVSRATSAETDLNTAITNETLRAQAADNELYQKISDETADRAAGDADLLSKINQEVSRAQVAENTISGALTTERNDRINDVTNLTNALTAETQAREAKDAELEQMIIDATLTFDDTASIDFNIPSQENNVVKANVKLQEGENIIKLGSGLYATVSLSYDSARNTIKLVTSNGEQEAIQLNTVGSLIDGMEYDATNRALVIKYHDAAGNPKEISFPVNQLFNDWEVDNPSSNSAIKLTKKSPVEPDDPDKLSAQALITDDFNGDGKPDEGSPNIIEIRNNGLFVDGSAMEDAKEIAECVKNECKEFEKAVIGHIIGNECGSGYTYERNNLTRYINTATSFNNADVILDANLDRIENYADEISAKTDCVDSKTEALYKMLYTNASPIPECGAGAVYQPYQGACVISAATSFMDADMLLNDQICEILEMWVSGETCTSKSTWTDEGANKKMMVDVKLSRGNNGTMSDDEIVIENLNGDYIDPTRTEFTDTNALRIVCLQEGSGGVIPAVNTPQNGVYLSNVWDCGLYYDEATDADAIAAAQAAGYLTDNYRTDTNPDASNYNYMNNVRQSDIPHN